MNNTATFEEAIQTSTRSAENNTRSLRHLTCRRAVSPSAHRTSPPLYRPAYRCALLRRRREDDNDNDNDNDDDDNYDDDDDDDDDDEDSDNARAYRSVIEIELRRSRKKNTEIGTRLSLARCYEFAWLRYALLHFGAVGTVADTSSGGQVQQGSIARDQQRC